MATKQRNCKKGFPCGKSCINKQRKCRNVLEGQAASFADWLKGQSDKATAGEKPKRKLATVNNTAKQSKPKGEEVSAFDVPNKDKKAYPSDFLQNSSDEEDFFLEIEGSTPAKSRIDKGAADLSKGKLLGKGGYGAVFEVEGHAIKVQESEGIIQERRASRLQNLLAKEGLAPKIEGVFYAPDNTIQTKMEKLEGYETLESVLKSSENKAEAFEKYRSGIEKITEALERNKINHGDMHEGNIMVDIRTGDAKIIDFGLAEKGGSKGDRNSENRALLDAFKGADTKFHSDGQVIRDGADEITFDWLDDDDEEDF